MLNNVFGLIYAGEQNINLIDLTTKRAIGALPVAGRYRAIDFQISNMVNSGIRNVGVITQRNYQSLMDHLGSGKDWDLSRKNDGLFILPPYDTIENSGDHRGVCDAVKNAMSYVRRAPQQYCLLTGSYTIYNATYHEMYKAHIENNADVTVLYNVANPAFDRSAGFKEVRMTIDETGRVTDMEQDAFMPSSTNVGMDIYLIRKDLLEYLVEDATARGKYSFVSDVLIPNLKRLRVFGVKYDGYVGRMSSVASYFAFNKDTLNVDVQKDLFNNERPVYTKIKDEAPVKYGANASVKNSIIADGCIIEGKVENSVLFRSVYVGKGTVIKNSIIMQDSEIYQNCYLENVILDKKVHIRSERRLIGDESYPVIIKKGAFL